jgi:hypothetical protein
VVAIFAEADKWATARAALQARSHRNKRNRRLVTTRGEKSIRADRPAPHPDFRSAKTHISIWVRRMHRDMRIRGTDSERT